MLERFRIAFPKSIVRHLTRPRILLVQWRLWLAAKSPTTEDKRRFLQAVLQLDPETQPASLALLLLDQQRPRS